MAGARLNALQKHLKGLRRRGKFLQQDQLDTHAETTSALKDYAKMSCRQLCDDVYNSFPREMRDMIYGHLNDGAEVHVPDTSCGWTTNYFSSTSASQCSAGSADCWDSRDRCDHWWCREYVGDLMHREITEYYFRTTCFGFEGNFKSMARFRITDQWNVGFLPASIASNISFRIRCDDYEFKGLLSPQEMTRRWIDTNERRPCAKLLSNLESVFGFKTGTKLDIRVAVADAKEGGVLEGLEWMCDTVLPFILPTLQRFEEVGYRLNLFLSGRPTPEYPAFIHIHGKAITPQLWKAAYEEVSPSDKQHNGC
jgi:hypothetical protein